MHELFAFVSWAHDVMRYSQAMAHHHDSMRGLIFTTYDSDLFIAFTHMQLPVYLMNPGFVDSWSITQNRQVSRL